MNNRIGLFTVVINVGTTMLLIEFLIILVFAELCLSISKNDEDR